MEIKLIKVTKDNKKDLVDLALSQYIGESCRICGHRFMDLEDLKERSITCCGTNPLKFACKKCWDKTQKEVKR